MCLLQQGLPSLLECGLDVPSPRRVVPAFYQMEVGLGERRKSKVPHLPNMKRTSPQKACDFVDESTNKP